MTPGQVKQLLGLALLLEKWGRTANLSGHKTVQAIIQNLVLDACALSAVLPSPPVIADLGSGAGFPALPLAVLRPAARVFLVEARERRHFFQRAAVRELGLVGAEPLRGRAEELEPRAAGLVVAQAMGPIDQVVEWMSAWAEPGATLAIPTSASATRPAARSGLVDAGTVTYRQPVSGDSRHCWVARVAEAAG